jgi:alpha-1,2-mannosyltransferase
MRLADAFARLLPLIALGVLLLTVGVTLAVAGDTHGYDFRAYYAAADRVLHGQSAYDQAFELAGAGGLFFYPPAFVPMILPFALLPVDGATWLWTGLMLAAFGAAVSAMPVGRPTRWWIVLLAGLSWPFVYNIKLGQVGPLLLLLFALTWRWRDRPAGFGVASGLGAAIKVQPGLLLVWALARRRWGAVVAGAVTLLAIAGVALPFTGLAAWPDFLALLTRVADPIATPQNLTPGAVAWQLGASHELAALIQLLSTVLVVAVFVVSVVWLPEEASLMVAIVATQLVSPILWDHYAIVLLLPTAWLLDRGHLWAALVPLVTPVFLVGTTPPVVYPVAFAATLGLVVVEGYRDRPRSRFLANGASAHA